jgi:hypothetical protein
MTVAELEDRRARIVMGFVYLFGLACELLLVALMLCYPEINPIPVAGYLVASAQGFILSVVMLCDPRKYDLIGWLWGLAMAFCAAWCLTLACLMVRLSQ